MKNIILLLTVFIFLKSVDGGSLMNSICGINPGNTCPVSIKKFDLDVKDFICSPACEFSLQDLADIIDPHIQRAKTCINGGHYNSSSQQCDCVYGYVGDSCEVYLGVCVDVSCLNDGKCDVSDGTCHCTKGYTGSNCERKVACPNSNFEWSDGGCRCKPNFVGSNCESCDPTLMCLPDISSEAKSGSFVLSKISDTRVSQFILSAPSTPLTKDLKPFRPAVDENGCGCSTNPNTIAPVTNKKIIRAKKPSSTHRLLENIVSNRLLNDDDDFDDSTDIDCEYPAIFLHHLHEHHHRSLNDDDDDSWWGVGVFLILSSIILLIIIVYCCYAPYFKTHTSSSKPDKSLLISSSTSSRISNNKHKHSSKKKSESIPWTP
jgi:hypothetical protein